MPLLPWQFREYHVCDTKSGIVERILHAPMPRKYVIIRRNHVCLSSAGLRSASSWRASAIALSVVSRRGNRRRRRRPARAREGEGTTLETSALPGNARGARPDISKQDGVRCRSTPAAAARGESPAHGGKPARRSSTFSTAGDDDIINALVRLASSRNHAERREASTPIQGSHGYW